MGVGERPCPGRYEVEEPAQFGSPLTLPPWVVLCPPFPVLLGVEKGKGVLPREVQLFEMSVC